MSIRVAIADDHRILLAALQAMLAREPDIAVPEDPTALAKGTDPQLERAIKEVQDRVAREPPVPSHPPYEKRVPGGGR